MKSVEVRPVFSRKHLGYLGIFLAYFIGTLLFLYFGLQPATNPSEVYAAEAATADSELSIPGIDLTIPTTSVSITNNELEVPEQIVGSYSVHQNKTLLIGHASTAFSSLSQITLGQPVYFGDKTYTVSDIQTLKKADISMKQVLKAEDVDTLVLMTCAGEQITDTDFSHRLIVTATINQS